MERWFLAGAIVGLLILIFDKRLAEEIIGEVSGPNIGNQPSIVGATSVPQNILPSNPTGCVSCKGQVTTVAAPQSPSNTVLAPSQSRRAPVYGEAIQVQGSPAPQPVLINGSFPLY